jgi:hypothetical protein
MPLESTRFVSVQPTTRREFLRRAAVTGAATLAWTAPTVSTVSLSTAQAGSNPPGDGNENDTHTETETNVLSETGSRTDSPSVLGTQYEATGTNVLGSGGGTLPKTGAPVDIPTAAAAAAGMIAGGAALSKLGSRKLGYTGPVEPAPPEN